MTLPFPGLERAKRMGEIKRGDQVWEMFLETQPDPSLGAVRGRLHFICSSRHRMTGWVFLEWQEREIHERFGEFSEVELWHFLESLEEEQVS